MQDRRTSGVFLHITSLPGPHGIGDLGPGTEQFLEFLDRADQSLWQFCPVGPTTDVHGRSPYAATSAFAGDPLLVDLHDVATRGYLKESELDPPAAADPHSVEYDAIADFKRDRLRRAYDRFVKAGDSDSRSSFDAFREQESNWLPDYTLFATLKSEYGGKAWPDWPTDLANYDQTAVAAARDQHEETVEYHAFVQWIFDEQWQALRQTAADHEIGLVGDLPIYVAADSADVWANQSIFELDATGQPAVVAGVPPNPGDDGQRWGNPVYDWTRLRDSDYAWWTARLDRLLSLVDLVRIDHFKALDEYWAIPADAANPADGEWRDAPGADFLETVAHTLGVDPTGLPFIVEDLGFLDDGVVALRDRFNLPGMRVPQYADWCDEGNRDKPVNYPRDSVAYTSTHDTDTVVGYYADLPERQRDCLHFALGTDGTEIHWDLIEAVWDSEAMITMTTVPDLLGLGSTARFNTPGTSQGNWRWRVTSDGLDPEVAGQLATVTDVALR